MLFNDMMLTDKVHGAGLRALFTCLLGKTDFHTDIQGIKICADDTVTVKVNVASIGAGDTAEIFAGMKLTNGAMGWGLMGFDLAPLLDLFGGFFGG